MSFFDSMATCSHRVVTLEKIQLGAAIRISEHLMDSELEIFKTAMGELEFKVRGYVLGHNLPPQIIKLPTDWWQAVKERWFPAWAKRRWPVQYRQWEATGVAFYPDFKPQIPKHHLVFQLAVRELTHE